MIAERLRTEEKFEAAIAEYEVYIQERLEDQDAPPEYNPNFYFLLIGDCYQGLDKPEEALAAYLKAKDNKVDSSIVGSKLRSLASWYEQRARYEEAIALLQQHRELDPLLFDLDIDRNHKLLVGTEVGKQKLY